MTVLKVTVDNEQLEHIKKMLYDAHVINIEEEKIANFIQKTESSLERIKKILEDAKGKELFKDIEDPSEWQREIRKEWDRDF